MARPEDRIVCTSFEDLFRAVSEPSEKTGSAVLFRNVSFSRIEGENRAWAIGRTQFPESASRRIVDMETASKKELAFETIAAMLASEREWDLGVYGKTSPFNPAAHLEKALCGHSGMFDRHTSLCAETVLSEMENEGTIEVLSGAVAEMAEDCATPEEIASYIEWCLAPKVETSLHAHHGTFRKEPKADDVTRKAAELLCQGPVGKAYVEAVLDDRMEAAAISLMDGKRRDVGGTGTPEGLPTFPGDERGNVYSASDGTTCFQALEPSVRESGVLLYPTYVYKDGRWQHAGDQARALDDPERRVENRMLERRLGVSFEDIQERIESSAPAEQPETPPTREPGGRPCRTPARASNRADSHKAPAEERGRIRKGPLPDPGPRSHGTKRQTR